MTDEKKIDALIEEAMSQVQVFASAWSMVGGPFDDGDCLENAEVEKHVTRALFRDLVNTAIQAARATAEQPEPDALLRAFKRIEALRKGLFEARDAMRVMSNWVKKSDPAGHSWAVRMVERANDVLSHKSQKDAAIESKQAESSIPEGYVLVPIEPTQAMMDAGLYQSSHDSTSADVHSIWKDMVAAASESKPAGQSADGWINVDERMPNEREMVLVFRPDAHYLPACDPNIDVRAYFGNGVFNGIHPVTHWMPLPAPPA